MMQNWRRRAHVPILAGLVAFIVGIFLLSGAPARAFNSYLTAAKQQYSAITGTDLDGCALCHVSPDDLTLNPYGVDFRDNGFDFVAIEGMDSDVDTYSNSVEISALSFPGDPASTPAPAATATPTATATSTPTSTPQPTATATPVVQRAWLPLILRMR